jgi:hypothetical protein
MSARQIIQEIETLPFAEQRQVFVSLQERLRDDDVARAPSTPNAVRYMDLQTARPLIKEVLAQHAELFRKLAQ